MAKFRFPDGGHVPRDILSAAPQETAQRDALSYLGRLKSEGDEAKRYWRWPNQVGRNIERGVRNVARVGTNMVLPAAAAAATASMMAPIAVGTGLGVPTMKAMGGFMFKSALAGVSADQIYLSMGGEFAGDMLNLKNPFARTVGNMVSPGTFIAPLRANAGIKPSNVPPKMDSFDRYFSGKINEPIKKGDILKRQFKKGGNDIYRQMNQGKERLSNVIKDEINLNRAEITKYMDEAEMARRADKKLSETVSKRINQIDSKLRDLPGEKTISDYEFKDLNYPIPPQYAAFLDKKGMLFQANKNPQKYLNDEALLSEFIENYPKMTRGVKVGIDAPEQELYDAIKIGGTGQHGPGSYFSNSKNTLKSFATPSDPSVQVGYEAFVKANLPGWAKATNKQKLNIIKKHVAYGREDLFEWDTNPDKIMLEVRYGPGFEFAERVIKKDAWKKYKDLVNIEKIMVSDQSDPNIAKKYGKYGLGDAKPSDDLFLHDSDITDKIKAIDKNLKREISQYNSKIKESLETAIFLNERIKALNEISQRSVNKVLKKTTPYYERIDELEGLRHHALKEAETTIREANKLYEKIIFGARASMAGAGGYTMVRLFKKIIEQKDDRKENKPPSRYMQKRLERYNKMLEERNQNQ